MIINIIMFTFKRNQNKHCGFIRNQLSIIFPLRFGVNTTTKDVLCGPCISSCVASVWKLSYWKVSLKQKAEIFEIYNVQGSCHGLPSSYRCHKSIRSTLLFCVSGRLMFRHLLFLWDAFQCCYLGEKKVRKIVAIIMAFCYEH